MYGYGFQATAMMTWGHIQYKIMAYGRHNKLNVIQKGNELISNELVQRINFMLKK